MTLQERIEKAAQNFGEQGTLLVPEDAQAIAEEYAKEERQKALKNALAYLYGMRDGLPPGTEPNVVKVLRLACDGIRDMLDD